jgi:hypothetical protein
MLPKTIVPESKEEVLGLDRGFQKRIFGCPFSAFLQGSASAEFPGVRKVSEKR